MELLENGIDVEAQDTQGCAALSKWTNNLWIREGYAMARILPEGGVDTSAADVLEHLPLYESLIARKLHVTMLKFLLGKGANIDIMALNG